MVSWRDVPNEVLRREWTAALSAEVGSRFLHADLGRRLVELAAEMDRRILAGERGLLPRPGPPVPRPVVPTALADPGWLRAYITRGVMLPAPAGRGSAVRSAAGSGVRALRPGPDITPSWGTGAVAATSRGTDPSAAAAR